MVTSFIIESFYCIKTIDVMQMISYWSHRKLRSRYFETNQSVAFILHVTLIARHFFWYLFSFLMQQLHMRDFFYLCQMERPREKYVFYWTISPIGGHYFLLLFILLVWSLCNLNSYIHVIDFIKLHQIEIQWIQSSQWFYETMQFVSYEINLM